MTTTQDVGAQRTERLNVRVSGEVDDLLRDAAAVEHKSLSAFVVEAAVERARRTLDEHRRITIASETFNRLLDELDRPAEVVEPLAALARRSRERRATA